jgi:hypothetical protein
MLKTIIIIINFQIFGTIILKNQLNISTPFLSMNFRSESGKDKNFKKLLLMKIFGFCSRKLLQSLKLNNGNNCQIR